MERNILKPEEEEYLHSIYFNPENPGSFGGVDKLFRYVKKDKKFPIKKTQVQHWLSKQTLYTAHKQSRRKFKRERIVAAKKNYQWEMDTINMVKYADENNHFKYIVVAIDVFTKHARAQPIKNLSTSEAMKALKSLFKYEKPDNARTDMGAEFVSKKVENYFKSLQINHFTSKNEVKCAIVERFIKTLKMKIVKNMQHNNNSKWLNLLPKFLDNYNNSYNRSIQMTPTEALSASNFEIYKNLYLKEYNTRMPNVQDFKFNINDRVKISYLRTTFERAYQEKWSPEIFTVIERFEREGIHSYYIKDWNNEQISGRFYENELQKVYVDENTTYKIDQIIRKRTRKGNREVLVRWVGYSSKFDSWVKESELIDI